jgi:C-terminal processing protease CtpA/Prc
VDSDEATATVEEVITLVGQHYFDVEVAADITRALLAGLADGRYRLDETSLAEAVTADLQSINGDKHLRLIHHVEPLAEREHGDDTEELIAMARWADQTSGGIAKVERMRGNVGYLDIEPVLFPVAQCGDAMSAAMSLVAPTDALIIDVRHCLGGDPAMVAWLCSYLYGYEPVQLSSLHERDLTTQSWTLSFVPGRRFGATKPVYVLTSATTFSGGEQLAYDLQQLKRATIVGEVTKGGAHAREGFRVHAHFEATVSVARGVNPISGSNWEGSGVVPDVAVPADEALDRAYELAVEHLAAATD